MPRRVGLLAASIAILLALCLPATTLAYKGINYSREETFCTGLQAHLKVKFWAAGNTNATKLTVDSFAQRAPAGEAWITIKNLGSHAYSFTNTGQTHGVTVARAYTGKDNYYWYRIQMKLRAWNGSTLLKQYLVNSIHC